jgi:tetratricopeptide (TPR) repeat protein
VAHHQAGRLKSAEEDYQKVLHSVPDCAQALHLMGLLARSTGRHELAVHLIEQANTVSPEEPDTLKSLASLYLERGDKALARSCYERLVQLCPEQPEIFEQLAAVHEQSGDYEPAARCYQKALLLKPGDGDLQKKLAGTLCQAGEHQQALRILEHALLQAPGDWSLYSEAGRVLTELGQWQLAVQMLQKALSINADAAEAFCNLGYFFFSNRDLRAAIESYRHALELDPGMISAYSYLGVALQELGDLAQALDCFCRARQLQPGDAQHTFNISTIHLLQGDYARGWPEYEARWSIPGRDRRDFCQPQWKGEPLQGERILVHAEQGLGDTMQFVRYLPLIVARGGQVILEVQPRLRRFLSGVNGAVQVISRGDPLPDYAWHCPLLSLPLALQTDMASIPSDVPYLHADGAKVGRWKQRLASNGLRIGLCWNGSPLRRRNMWRSIPLELLAPLLRIEGTTFYSLQMGEPAKEMAAVPDAVHIVDLSGEQEDFDDAAAIVANLDLTITIDTSIAHLAGAMGKPVWVMLNNTPDWRWSLNREDSLWYPTARLFRQTAPGEWQPVVNRVQEELQAHVAKHKAIAH